MGGARHAIEERGQNSGEAGSDLEDGMYESRVGAVERSNFGSGGGDVPERAGEAGSGGDNVDCVLLGERRQHRADRRHQVVDANSLTTT